jgi:hypothetical protein
MIPEFLASEWGERFCGVTHEASGSMGIESQEEGNEKMMRIPEGFVGLLADTMMRSGIHQEHTK